METHYKNIILSNGVEMPPIVQTTNWQDYEQMTELVMEGLKVGFRAFDTARDYSNEHIVGRVLEECLKRTGISRKDVFITTKIGNSQQENGDIYGEIEKSLENLHTDYVDLWLMHWPYPGYFDKTWKKMEKVYSQGKVRAIGVANYNMRYFRKLFNAGIEVVPHCLQLEHHPMRTADDILAFCKVRQISIQAYSPLCRMIPAIRDNAILKQISVSKGKSIPQVILRWHYQHLSVPVFKTLKPHRLGENFNIWDFELSEQEMRQISSLDADYKYHIESASCPGY